MQNLPFQTGTRRYYIGGYQDVMDYLMKIPIIPIMLRSYYTLSIRNGSTAPFFGQQFWTKNDQEKQF